MGKCSSKSNIPSTRNYQNFIFLIRINMRLASLNQLRIIVNQNVKTFHTHEILFNKKGQIFKEKKKKTVKLLGSKSKYKFQPTTKIKENKYKNKESFIVDKKIELKLPSNEKPQKNVFKTEEELNQLFENEELIHDGPRRPPIVSIMGHVDHGKTTLLDSLRNTNVASNEPGYITQHMSAFVVDFDGRHVTFIDTPGHAAFEGIRGRGAKINDITVLVVDTCEGVKPQTKEVIDLINEYQIPTIIALNKIDREKSDIEMTEFSLVEAGLVPNSYGGQVPSVEISGLKKTNLDKLLQAIYVEADKLDLRVNQTISAKGYILETCLTLGHGVVATLIVQRGTLTRGTILVASKSLCRVRQILPLSGMSAGEMEHGVKPGYPCQITGWRSTPLTGSYVTVIENEQEAKMKNQIALENENISEISLEKLEKKLYGDTKSLYLVIKTDVAGSLEAIVNLFEGASPEEVKIKILRAEVGEILEADIIFANKMEAHLLGYNINLSKNLEGKVKHSKLPVFCHNIIYKHVDYVRDHLEEKIDPNYVEEVVAEATVLKSFTLPDKSKAYGCEATRGRIEYTNKIKILRKKTVIYDGPIKDLKHKKKNVPHVEAGTEFGIRLEDFNELQELDKILSYILTPVKKSIQWNLDTTPDRFTEENKLDKVDSQETQGEN